MNTDANRAARTGWSSARREIAVAAGLAVTVTAAAWAIDGPAAAGLVALICIGVSLVLLRLLVVPDTPEPDPAFAITGRGDQPVSFLSITGFWRTQADLTHATRSLSAFDLGTRPRLTNLFAARLAERHGISLASEPDSAKALLQRGSPHLDLWYWIDPDRPTPPDAVDRPGIPPRVLAALIDRLEKL